VYGLEFLDRGYAGIEHKLNGVGAAIQRIDPAAALPSELSSPRLAA
jgi:hypothetical protein